MSRQALVVKLSDGETIVVESGDKANDLSPIIWDPQAIVVTWAKLMKANEAKKFLDSKLKETPNAN